MNIFLGLKELFNKNIDCGEDMNNHIVFFLKKKKYLYINKNIIVRDGCACVVVYKNKVRDVILPGKYKINDQIIPVTYSKAKVEKKSKKGAKVKRIRANLYYVNTSEVKSFNFDSNEHFVIKNKESGRVKGFAQGYCTLRVIDPGVLIKTLLFKYNKIKNKLVAKEIGLLVGNRINKKIQKDKISPDMIFNAHEKLNSLLNFGLEDSYDNVGLYIKNIKLKAINFPKKSQKKINKYLINHKKIFNSSSIVGSNWSVRSDEGVTVSNQVKPNAMQNPRIRPNVNTFKICNRCGFKNHTSAINCRNCGDRFN